MASEPYAYQSISLLTYLLGIDTMNTAWHCGPQYASLCMHLNAEVASGWTTPFASTGAVVWLCLYCIVSEREIVLMLSNRITFHQFVFAPKRMVWGKGSNLRVHSTL